MSSVVEADGRAKKRPSRAAVKVAPRADRRYRQTIQRIDLWSVLKVSLCFYLSTMIVLVVAGAVLWLVADSLGVIHNVEDFMNQLLSSKDFKFLSAQILQGGILIGLVVVALLVILTVVAAAFYNLFAELLGGVEIVIREEDTGPPI
ncbi:MAG: Transrane domain of unknown function [Actinomycetia bacterium]|nr:Transrane domain of unknown function [Actinomycetes bacterium]